MTYKEELKKQCEALSNEELLLVVKNKALYNEQIVTAAQIELRKRNISKDEAKTYKETRVRQGRIISGNVVDDISTFEKILFFFLCFPRLFYWVTRDYHRRQYVLKLRQAGYYSVLGLISILHIMIIGIKRIGLSTGLMIWALCFVAAYIFDHYYFRERTIRRLKMRMADTEETSQV